MKSSIAAVCLDLDGTLVDAFPPIIRALNQTLREFGLPPMTAEEVKRHTGRGGRGVRELFGDRQQQATARFLEIHDEDYLRHIRPLPGAEELLTWLREQSIPRAVVTSKSQARAEAQLQALGWDQHIDVVIGKVDGRPEKPDPTPILLACASLGVDPADAVMVGDGVADMQAACHAGCRGLGICDAFSAEELRAAGAECCFASLHEVREWIRRHR